jgi:hypothetical protein
VRHTFQTGGHLRKRGYGWTFIPFLARNEARIVDDEGRHQLGRVH